jgi:predicted Zn-dependent protease with MMP-like domain
MSEQRFAGLVESALDALPEEVRHWLDNVEVVVADWPSREHLSAVGVGSGGTLLGLYEGVPITERSAGYGMVLPDKVTIFRGPILSLCQTEDDVEQKVRRTVLHELAHHFGLDDDHLIRLGAY